MISGNMTQKEIAGAIKVSPNTICEWKKKEEFNAEYANALKAGIKDVAAKAFKKERELLEAKSEMVQLQAAKDILDRAGFKPDDSVTVEHIGTIDVGNPFEELTTEELRRLAYGNSE